MYLGVILWVLAQDYNFAQQRYHHIQPTLFNEKELLGYPFYFKKSFHLFV